MILEEILRGSVGRRDLVVESGRVSLSSVGSACSLITASAFANPYSTVPTDNPVVSVSDPGPASYLSCPVGSGWKDSKVGLIPPFPITMFLALLGAKGSSGQGTSFWYTSPVDTGPLLLGSYSPRSHSWDSPEPDLH